MSFLFEGLFEIVLQACVEGSAWIIEKRFGAAGCLIAMAVIAILVGLLIWAIA
ncbi:hypothetical protein [Sphingomonas sp. OTU376]|uniref:hypothetical protein n=1 Tax=Sphingomonas sp. OTU376 TaxID=3043863 RepID=UPI00313C0A36